jgi:hypothetical protein
MRSQGRIWFVSKASGDSKLANPEVSPGIGELGKGL